MKTKKRLDVRVQELYPQLSRSHIQSLIAQGNVTVNSTIVQKSGAAIAPDAVINLDLAQEKYVSRAGYKLEQALKHFNIDVTNYTVIDAGLSTGGFTDCLLQLGAQKVYGIDVGHSQVHKKIANDPRVVVLEQTNLRDVRDVGQLVDLVTLDLSFISVLKVMDAVNAVLKPHGKLIILIKPQFEAGKEHIGRSGVIKDDKVHQKVIATVTEGIQKHEYDCIGVIESPLLGGDGNKEFLAYFVRRT